MITRAHPTIHPQGTGNGGAGQVSRLIVHPTAGGRVRGAHNCGACDSHVVAAIERYAVSGDIQEFDGLACDCQKAWAEEVALEHALPTPLGISKPRRGNLLNALRAP